MKIMNRTKGIKKRLTCIGEPFAEVAETFSNLKF